MNLSHISKAEELRQHIHARRDRCLAIQRRVETIRSAIPFMEDKDLYTAGKELAELRAELINHESYINWAQEQINAFYRNKGLEVA